MDVNFTDFDLRSPLLTSDFLVGYKQDASTEFRTTIATVLQTLQQNTPTETNVEIVKVAWYPDGNISIPSNVDIEPPFTTDFFNTNPDTFAIANLSSVGSAARVFVRQPGYYEISYQGLMQCLPGTNIHTIKLAYASNDFEPLTAIKVIDKKHFETNSDTANFTIEGSTLESVTVPGYYTVFINASGSGTNTNTAYSLQNNIPTFTLTIKKIK